MHVSRTPLDPPRFADVFEAAGQATHLGQFELVIEAVVDFGTRPVTGEGTMTFTAANGDTLVADFTGSSALVAPGLVLITEHRDHRPRPAPPVDSPAPPGPSPSSASPTRPPA